MSQGAVNRHFLERSLNSVVKKTVRNVVATVFSLCICIAVVATGDEFAVEDFMEIDVDNIAFPDVVEWSESTRPLSMRKGDWSFTLSQEPDRQVLSAESGDARVTQSITPNAVVKRFVFDLRKERFEPMRQEIRIEQTNERQLEQIKQMAGVTAVKRYEKLGFSIVKINAEVNPIAVFRNLKDDFEIENARILTGFFEDEPM